MWTCKNIKITNSQINGGYFGKDKENIYLNNVSLIGNYVFDATKYIKENIPQISVVAGTATYLMWLDIHQITDNSAELAEFIKNTTGLIVSADTVYRGNGHDFLRINLACPEEMVKDGMQRLATGIYKFLNK